MPDLREWLLLLSVAGATALAVAWPLLGNRRSATSAANPEREALEIRHRVSLETLRDLEADQRAGLLDAASYAAQRAEAEARAAATLAELESVDPDAGPPARVGGRRVAAIVGAALGLLLLAGFAVPHPIGVAESTATNPALAQAVAQEDARQARIRALLDQLAANPTDAQALSDLADAYLAGSGADDLRNAGVALLALIGQEPDNASAYRRLITAYINAGDWPDATSATEAFAGVAGEDDPDLAFFRGLVALRGSHDTAEALRQFDRFLQLAPDDPRVTMIKSLRAEAAGDLPGGG